MFNVVEYWYPVVVVRGFYTVVVLSVVSNQTRAVSSPRHLTNRHVVVASVSKTDTTLPIETSPDHYESVEVVKARGPCSHAQNIACPFGLLGKQGTGYPYGLFHVLMAQGFLGLFGNFFFKDVFGFAFDPACQTRCQASLDITRQF